VAHARQRSRHDGEPGQGALDHINVQWAITQRHERLDGLEPGRQHGALALVEVSHSLGTRCLWQASGRKPERGAWVWHVQHPAHRWHHDGHLDITA
jgi:hypothetical protein